MEFDLEAILQTFLAECEEHFAKMEEALVALEANPEDDQLLEAIFRGAHTLKGNSASLGYPKVAGFAHVFEELLQRFRNHALPVTQERITLLLRSLDAMRQMVPEAIAGAEELQAHHLELLNRLASGDSEPTGKFRNRPTRRAGLSAGAKPTQPTGWSAPARFASIPRSSTACSTWRAKSPSPKGGCAKRSNNPAAKELSRSKPRTKSNGFPSNFRKPS